MDKKRREEIINRFKNSPEEENSDLILEKQITKSEKERHWIHGHAIENYLPEEEEEFTLRERDQKDKEVETYLDSYNRIRIGSRGFRKLGLKAREARKIKLYKTQKKDLFEIKVIKEPEKE